ncbi:MAG: hypothetical protein KIT34_15570 [Cyanobacteria bacterium TGS_CYA1]|nr:hypothetical protein [Cyanobacteria bacterium TGS_CYA1]
MIFRRIFLLMILACAVLPAHASDRVPIFRYEDDSNGVVKTKVLVPTGSVVRFRVKSMNDKVQGDLKIAVADKNGKPLKLKDDKVAMWKLLGENQQEEVTVPNTQKLTFVLSSFRAASKLYPEKMIDPWSAEKQDPLNEINTLEFREPKRGEPKDKGNVVIEVKIIPPKF